MVWTVLRCRIPLRYQLQLCRIKVLESENLNQPRVGSKKNKLLQSYHTESMRPYQLSELCNLLISGKTEPNTSKFENMIFLQS